MKLSLRVTSFCKRFQNRSTFRQVALFDYVELGKRNLGGNIASIRYCLKFLPDTTFLTSHQFLECAVEFTRIITAIDTP